MRIRNVLVDSRPDGPLAPLTTLARDLDPRVQREVGAILARIDPSCWEQSGHNPARAIAQLSATALETASGDEDLIHAVEAAVVTRAERLATPEWTPPGAEGMLVAYFSCEFGLDASLPIYSGGLGLLSGDHLKAAADLRLPLVGVGLFYRNGYFRQDVAPDGRQVERYPASDETQLPMEPAFCPDGTPVRVTVDLAGETVTCGVWRAQTGGVDLYLLDTDLPENTPAARAITDLLYGGDREHRIRQELVLGIGGVRALAAIGLSPTVFHMNEGHSAFLAIERLRVLVSEHGLSVPEAMEAIRASSVFTTHTPVPAGNEVFEAELASRYVAPLVKEVGLDWDGFAAMARVPGQTDGPIGMTVLALRSARRANGVSALHGLVSRDMWKALWPGYLPTETPIGHVTNGVHTGTWLSDGTRSLLADRGLAAIEADPADPAAWNGAAEVDGHALWNARTTARRSLIEMVGRSGLDSPHLNPDALTIGFSRRFATYKRAALLLRQPERLRALLTHPDRPVQIVLAGKAHPHDDPGKGVLQSILSAARSLGITNQVAFVPDYDIAVAKVLVAGADVWLNTPRRPYEASGTSGMKAALNGVLNLSVLDGWWPEGYAPDLGWAIGDERSIDDAELQDSRDAESLFSLLESDVVPAFYERDHDGLPQRWLAMMRRSMCVLGPQFSTQRMVREYAEQFYGPAHVDGARMSADSYQGARDGAAWRARMSAAWSNVRIVDVVTQPTARAGSLLAVDITVDLASIAPDDVRVEVVVGEPDPVGFSRPSIILATRTQSGYRAEVPVSHGGRVCLAARVVANPGGLPLDAALATWEANLS